MTVRTGNDYPKTILALSAVPVLLPEDAELVPSIERELERIEAGASPDRLIEYIWPGQSLERSMACDPQAITESELRAMWGDR